jgi:hypothetical protein
MILGTTGRYWVITPGVEGMTATNAFNGQPTTPQDPKSLHCFEGILGTGGLKPATRRKEGGNPATISVNTPKQ